MRRKIIVSLLIIAFLAVAGGSFYWWQGQQSVRGLNETLPDGVRVKKSLFSNEYFIINNIDGYEFRVPMAWEGIEKIEYILEEEAMGLKGTGIGIKGKNNGFTLLSLDIFYLEQKDIDLLEWTRELWELSGFVGDLTKDTVGDLNIVKGAEGVHLGGTYLYFLEKNKKIYILNNGSEEFIQEIILNGKW